MFSDRVPAQRINRLAEALADRRARGASLIDLTESNPTRVGITYPPDLLSGLDGPAGPHGPHTPHGSNALVYAPRPLGLPAAREAVAADYRRRGIAVAPDRIALTASSSESYSFLFKVLCDPGDEVLIPRPSYPLFEHLTRLDGVVGVPYDLEYHGAWTIDLAQVGRQISPRTRAILLVSPNNPTGSFVTASELAHIAGLCAAHSMAIIADEVFADYELTPGEAARGGRPLDARGVLACSLGGLSKAVGLPQMKLGWIAVGGEPALADAALARLELVADTYLSVSTLTQLAAPGLLERGAIVRAQIQQRTRANLAWLSARITRNPSCRLLNASGGWSAVVRVPTLEPEEDLVLALLEREGVLVHPGYFFDFAYESHLVISLLPPPADFSEGMSRVLQHFDRAFRLQPEAERAR